MTAPADAGDRRHAAADAGVHRPPRRHASWTSAWRARGTRPSRAPAQGARRGGPRPSRRSGPPAVTIRFRMPALPAVQTLCYARVRMEDREFEKQAAVLAYLDRAAPFTTFVKSASYLMHDDRFSRVRSVILKGSQSVLEDDSGVPYRFFDKAGWDVTLLRPVLASGEGLQVRLAARSRGGVSRAVGRARPAVLVRLPLAGRRRRASCSRCGGEQLT